MVYYIIQYWVIICYSILQGSRIHVTRRDQTREHACHESFTEWGPRTLNISPKQQDPSQIKYWGPSSKDRVPGKPQGFGGLGVDFQLVAHQAAARRAAEW